MKFIKKNLKWITIIFVIVLIIILIGLKIFLLKKDRKEDEIIKIKEQQEETIFKEEEIEIIKKISVDIKGAVALPGVYEIEEDKRVIDVVNLAGGFTEEADTSLINLAKQVKSEMVIIIYTKEEVKKAIEKNEIVKIIDNECVCPEVKNDACINNNTNDKNKTNNKETTKDKENNNQTNTKINLNTATLEELKTLSGIGNSKAQAIIDYRDEKGGFKTIEELIEVPGIGQSTYDEIKDNITV